MGLTYLEGNPGDLPHGFLGGAQELLTLGTDGRQWIGAGFAGILFSLVLEEGPFGAQSLMFRGRGLIHALDIINCSPQEFIPQQAGICYAIPHRIPIVPVLLATGGRCGITRLGDSGKICLPVVVDATGNKSVQGRSTVFAQFPRCWTVVLEDALLKFWIHCHDKFFKFTHCFTKIMINTPKRNCPERIPKRERYNPQYSATQSTSMLVPLKATQVTHSLIANLITSARKVHHKWLIYAIEYWKRLERRRREKRKRDLSHQPTIFHSQFPQHFCPFPLHQHPQGIYLNVRRGVLMEYALKYMDFHEQKTGIIAKYITSQIKLAHINNKKLVTEDSALGDWSSKLEKNRWRVKISLSDCSASSDGKL